MKRGRSQLLSSEAAGLGPPHRVEQAAIIEPEMSDYGFDVTLETAGGSGMTLLGVITDRYACACTMDINADSSL
jgi:hypothetical protein